VMMSEGADSDEDIVDQAAEWIDDNRDQVDEWLAYAMENADNTELAQSIVDEWVNMDMGEDMEMDMEATEEAE